jgi:hypothetical protein
MFRKGNFVSNQVKEKQFSIIYFSFSAATGNMA